MSDISKWVPALQAFYVGLAPHTRRARWGTFVSDEALKRYAADLARPGVRLALVGAGKRISGVAELVLLSGCRGEVGVVVKEGEQRKGAGSILLEAIALQAKAEGVETLLFQVDRNNKGIHALLKGLPTRKVQAGPEQELEVALAEIPFSWYNCGKIPLVRGTDAGSVPAVIFFPISN